MKDTEKLVSGLEELEKRLRRYSDRIEMCRTFGWDGYKDTATVDDRPLSYVFESTASDVRELAEIAKRVRDAQG